MFSGWRNFPECTKKKTNLQLLWMKPAEGAWVVRHKQDVLNSKVGLIRVLVKRWLGGWMDGRVTPTLPPNIPRVNDDPHGQIRHPPSVTLLFRRLPLLKCYSERQWEDLATENQAFILSGGLRDNTGEWWKTNTKHFPEGWNPLCVCVEVSRGYNARNHACNWAQMC